MQVQKTNLSATRIKLMLQADQLLLDDVKAQVIKRLNRDLKLPGFRKGHAPAALAEKNINPATLQSEFLDAAVNSMYVEALTQEKIRPVAQPKVDLKKFVPFTTLEVDAEVEAIGEITLPDYKKVKLAKKPVKVTDKDVDDVIVTLKTRLSDKKEVKRAAQEGDEVVIDFTGTDAKTTEPIQGADGKDYSLVLGSNNFIPGFEANLVGMKAGEEKTFMLTFPKDYGVQALQSKKVAFATKITKVSEMVEPKLDNAFAAKVGPFKTVEELKADIKKQVTSEREYQNDRDYESDLLSKITEEAHVAIPEPLTDEELNRLEREERQNITYRGQTWQEHLDSEGVTEEEHRAKNLPGAEMRVKAGLVLAEIAEKEQIEVTAAELSQQLQALKQKYPDPKMQAELDNPDSRREVASRILSEKTIAILVGYASK